MSQNPSWSGVRSFVAAVALGLLIAIPLAVLLSWWRFRRYAASPTIEIRHLGDSATGTDRVVASAAGLGFVDLGSWRIVVDGGSRSDRITLLNRPPDGTVLAIGSRRFTFETSLSSGQQLVTSDRLGFLLADQIVQCVPRASLHELDRVHRDGLQRLRATGVTWREPTAGPAAVVERGESAHRDLAEQIGWFRFVAGRLRQLRPQRCTIAEGTARTSPGRSAD